MHFFTAGIEIIVGNPYVFVPDSILRDLFKEAGKDKGPIPIRRTINDKPYRQTLVRYSGAWRLYVNMTMLKDSLRRIGELVRLTVAFDPESRAIEPPEKFTNALDEYQDARLVFESLSPSRRQEIVRYLANLKTEESLERNVRRAINFLLGKGRFVGRDKP